MKMRPDGTNLQEIPVQNRIREYGDVAWSPDGSMIATVVEHDVFDDQLVLVDTSSGLVTSVFETDGSLAKFTWAPDGKALAFQLSTADDRNGVYLTTFDDMVTAPILPIPFGILVGLDFGPDGSLLVGVTQSGVAELRRLTLDPFRYPKVGSGSFWETASWSPDGTEIVFVSRSQSGRTGIARGNLSGMVWPIVSNTDCLPSEPDWCTFSTAET